MLFYPLARKEIKKIFYPITYQISYWNKRKDLKLKYSKDLRKFSNCLIVFRRGWSMRRACISHILWIWWEKSHSLWHSIVKIWCFKLRELSTMRLRDWLINMHIIYDLLLYSSFYCFIRDFKWFNNYLYFSKLNL